MKKYRLFTPGPTPVSEQASLAMAQPIIHHRTKAFESIIQEVREDLRWLFQTKQDPLLIASSGTGAMEGTVTNLFSKGDRVIVVDGGKFGERWWKIGQAYGLETDIIKVEWGRAVEPQEIEKRLKNGNVRGLLVQASESSTGVYHPIREIAEIVKKYPDCLLAVDAISALCAINLPMDAWGIDLLLAASQKGLGLPPGLAFVALSEKAWGFAGKATLPRFYFDFKKEQKNLQKNQTAYTPAISLITGLAAVLRELKREGLEALFSRHERMAQATREAVQAMRLKLYAKSPSNSLTAVVSPDGIDARKIVKHLQDRFNITIAGGQDEAKGKIFRIAHLGYYDELDMVSVLAALEWTLVDLGYRLESGVGVGAAMRILKNG